MRGYTGVWALLAAIGYSAAAGGMAVDADAVKPQKEAALANWKQSHGGRAPRRGGARSPADLRPGSHALGEAAPARRRPGGALCPGAEGPQGRSSRRAGAGKTHGLSDRQPPAL